MNKNCGKRDLGGIVSKKRSSITKKKKSIPWREAAKDQIRKYTESGLMLRASRYKEGMTQKQLANRLDSLPHHISEMEHGKRPISKKMAEKLGAIFKVDYRIFL